MSIFHSLLLGLIQGITEFLPISSSGHLILVPRIFNWPDQGLAFDTIIHLATALAIIIAFWKEIVWLLTGRGSEINRLALEGDNCNCRLQKCARFNFWLILLIAIIPASLFGFFFNDWLENNLRSTVIVAVSLIFWGVILWLAEYYHDRLIDKSKQTIDLAKINWRQALIIGLAQVIAFIPGASRSGITISSGLFSGLNKNIAIKFSFLAGLPLILGAGLFELFKLANASSYSIPILPLAVGFISALISGIFSIKLLLWLSQKSSFKALVIYRIALGIIILIAI